AKVVSAAALSACGTGLLDCAGDQGLRFKKGSAAAGKAEVTLPIDRKLSGSFWLQVCGLKSALRFALGCAAVNSRASGAGGTWSKSGVVPPQFKVRRGFGLRGHVPAFPARPVRRWRGERRSSMLLCLTP